MIKDSGERTEFSTGDVRDMKDGKGRFDLLPWYGIMEVSKHCEEGAKKYGEHNVDRGIPLHSLMDSASRHLAKFIAGETDEDHLRAAAWNILWALNQRTTHPELNDMYWAKKDSDTKALTYQDLRKMDGKTVWLVSMHPAVHPGKYTVKNLPNNEVELTPEIENLYYGHLVITSQKIPTEIELYECRV